ncbi:hypothetical protein ECDEC15C_3026 [Escherichia coli DEC15C]|nr:hypothetical protein ECDEC15C_3026 [Escherichia coli DEC15C]
MQEMSIICVSLDLSFYRINRVNAEKQPTENDICKYKHQ